MIFFGLFCTCVSLLNSVDFTYSFSLLCVHHWRSQRKLSIFLFEKIFRRMSNCSKYFSAFEGLQAIVIVSKTCGLCLTTLQSKNRLRKTTQERVMVHKPWNQWTLLGLRYTRGVNSSSRKCHSRDQFPFGILAHSWRDYVTAIFSNLSLTTGVLCP